MLSVIIGNVELTLDRITAADPIHHTMQHILNAAKRAADLTRQLLAFARKQNVSPKVQNLNDTLSGMFKALQSLLGENIKLVWMPGQDLWQIKIDPSQLDQLLASLMMNASDDANKAGKIIIETSNMTCDEYFCAHHRGCLPGDYVLLAISDDGCGMGKDDLANIFEPFFTAWKDGLGADLGLATAYGIVKQNSGFIYVYSEPDMGTTFRIFLPRYEAGAIVAHDDKAATQAHENLDMALIAE
jgi:signal transduction histidine kinase